MIASQKTIRHWNLCHAPWRRGGAAGWRQQTGNSLFLRLSKQLGTNLTRNDLRQESRNGIAQHALSVIPSAVESQAVRQGLQSAQLLN
jgi:hypothetical protein